MYSYEQIVKKYAQKLKNITHIPQKEVQILLLFVLQKNTIWLHLNYNQECKVEEKLKLLVEKRATNYPLEYIVKKVSFYGETFFIEDGILIPRPETEILVEKAVDILKNIPKARVVEVGVGSGVICIMLALLIKDIDIIAVDINQKALQIAQKNAKRFKVEHKITFIQSDIFDSINVKDFDMCISNPPYIKNDYQLPLNVQYEPSEALFGGIQGDELVKRIIKNTINNNIGYLCCEIGYDQKNSIVQFTQQYNIKNIEFYKDYEKYDRGFILEFI
jgi:release factor glutamine methyltransferase